MISVDVSDIYRRAFNLEFFDSETYKIVTEQPAKPEATPAQIQATPKEKDKAYSWLGIPIMMPVMFKGKPKYNVLRGGNVETVRMDDYRLPDTTVVDLRLEKNIITTPINGGGGSVVEMYGFDNWQIKIYGLLIDTDIDILTHLEQLYQWVEICDAIEVSNEIFRRLNIRRIVIKSIDLPKKEGSSARPFALTCQSVEPVELIL